MRRRLIQHETGLFHFLLYQQSSTLQDIYLLYFTWWWLSTGVYVIVKFYPWFKFYFPLFLGMVINDNEFETKENKIWTKDKIEPQHIQSNLWFELSSEPRCYPPRLQPYFYLHNSSDDTQPHLIIANSIINTNYK